MGRYKALVPELPLDTFFTSDRTKPDTIIEERFWEFAPTFSAANGKTFMLN